ncbi:MAG: VOC family protein [Methyloligellaceae bacterium]
MPPTAILETALYVDDLDAAEHFYVDILGFKKYARVGNRHLFLKLDTQMLLIFNPQVTMEPSDAQKLPVPVHGTTGDGHVCFTGTATEISDWKGHLEANKVTIESDFHWPSGGRSIYFRDPSGNSLEFAEPSIWGMGEPD